MQPTNERLSGDDPQLPILAPQLPRREFDDTDPDSMTNSDRSLRHFGPLIAMGGGFALTLAMVFAGLSLIGGLQSSRPELAVDADSLDTTDTDSATTDSADTDSADPSDSIDGTDDAGGDGAEPGGLGQGSTASTWPTTSTSSPDRSGYELAGVVAQDEPDGIGRLVEVSGACPQQGDDEAAWLAVRPVDPAGEPTGLYPVADLSGCDQDGLVIIACSGEIDHAGQAEEIDPDGSGWTVRHCLGGPDGVGEQFDLLLIAGPADEFTALDDHFRSGDSANPVPWQEEPGLEPVDRLRISRSR